MTDYNTLKLKLSNSQINKLKSGIKNVVHDSNDENNFPHML